MSARARKYRLIDLKGDEVVVFTCPKCGRKGMVTPHELLRRGVRYFELLYDLGRRARCRRCHCRSELTRVAMRSGRD